MTRTIAAAAPSSPLWTSLSTAVRQTLSSFAAPAAPASAFEALEGEQARIRRSGRMWLVG